MKTTSLFLAMALALTGAGCTMADGTTSPRPNLLAETLPAEEVSYAGIGPDGTSVIGFGTAYPVLVRATDGTRLTVSHMEAAIAVAGIACEKIGRNAPAENSADVTHDGMIRFRTCG